MGWQEAINENGFAILPGIFSFETLDFLLHEIENVAPRRSRAGIRHALRLPPVAELARQPQLMELARGVLGQEAFPFRATVFDKSPMANWLVVWHQDTALPLRSRLEVNGWGPWSVKDGIHYAHAPTAVLNHVVSLRVSLDDSSVENGPLRVLPGIHRRGVLSDDDVHQIAASATPVDCVAARGAVVIMRPLTIHASSKSRSTQPRRVLHIEYAASTSIAEPLQLAIA